MTTTMSDEAKRLFVLDIVNGHGLNITEDGIAGAIEALEELAVEDQVDAYDKIEPLVDTRMAVINFATIDSADGLEFYSADDLAEAYVKAALREGAPKDQGTRTFPIGDREWALTHEDETEDLARRVAEMSE